MCYKGEYNLKHMNSCYYKGHPYTCCCLKNSFLYSFSFSTSLLFLPLLAGHCKGGSR